MHPMKAKYIGCFKTGIYLVQTFYSTLFKKISINIKKKLAQPLPECGERQLATTMGRIEMSVGTINWKGSHSGSKSIQNSLI